METRLSERTARSGGGFVTSSTVNKERTTLSAIFTYGVKNGWLAKKSSDGYHGTG